MSILKRIIVEYKKTIETKSETSTREVTKIKIKIDYNRMKITIFFTKQNYNLLKKDFNLLNNIF